MGICYSRNKNNLDYDNIDYNILHEKNMSNEDELRTPPDRLTIGPQNIYHQKMPQRLEDVL